MLIRSQDRLSTTTDLNIEICETYDYKGHELSTASGIDLGTYSTEEKAIKVLDMICEEYSKGLTVTNGKTIIDILEYPKVFQMPLDSEV